MKKRVLFLAALIWACSSAFAQETTIIAQWTFPSAVDSTLFPDSCISANETKYLSAEDTTAWPNTILRDVSMTQGATTNAATAAGWHNGKDAKLWSIKIKTGGLSNITVSSKQRSGGNTPGPKYWKIQARLSSTSFVDVPGGNVTCANNWTTGGVTDLPLQSTYDNQTGSMYIRWIMTSDSSSAGTIVDSLGISKIDDVIIKGTPASGIEEVIYNSNFNFYPNPNSGKSLLITSTGMIKEIKIYNIQGQLMETFADIDPTQVINLQDLQQGVYFIQPFFSDNTTMTPQKLIIE